MVDRALETEVNLGQNSFEFTDIWICEAHFPRHDDKLLRAVEKLGRTAGISKSGVPRFREKLSEVRSGRWIGFDFDADIWGSAIDRDSLPAGAIWAESSFVGIDPSLLLQITRLELHESLRAIPESILRSESYVHDDPFASVRLRQAVNSAMDGTMSTFFAWHSNTFGGYFAESNVRQPHLEAFITKNFEILDVEPTPWAQAMGFVEELFSWESEVWDGLRLNESIFRDRRLVVGRRQDPDQLGSLWGLWTYPAVFAWCIERVIDLLTDKTVRETTNFHEARRSRFKAFRSTKGWLDIAGDAAVAISAAQQPWEEMSACKSYGFAGRGDPAVSFIRTRRNIATNRTRALQASHEQMARWFETFGAFQLQRSSIYLAIAAIILAAVALVPQFL